MPDQFADALERLDVIFENVGPDMDIFNLLHTVLGRMPTQQQVALASEKLDFERRELDLQAFQVSFFLRQGAVITQLRDARGRFVTAGAARIQQFIRRL